MMFRRSLFKKRIKGQGSAAGHESRARVFSRRAAMLAGGQLALFGLLVGRLYQLQVVDRERYATLAEDNRIAAQFTLSPRGRIVDRFGVPLALNRESYRLIVIPDQTGSVATTLDALSAIVAITDADRGRVLREVTRRRRFVPVVVRENMSWDEVSRVAVNAPDLPGVAVEVGNSRAYPYGAGLAHLLGYVAPPAAADLTGDPLLELPDVRIGRNGIERVYDVALRGSAGMKHMEVNAFGRPIREIARSVGDPGLDVVMTIDGELQHAAACALAREQSGAAVVIDVNSGDVLAMVSHPGFDPGEFERGIPSATWQALTADVRNPLVNKAVAGQYSPGSTFKMMVALAALETGGVTPATRVTCPGYLELGDTRFHCWRRGGHGTVDMVEGIAQSCDVYFYEIARRTGPDKIADMARRFGLGASLALDLPGERPGLIPTRDWKQRTYGQQWTQGDSLVMGIGQGYVLATPLQLAVMTARLANGGIAITPHLTRDRIIERRAEPRAAGAFPRIDISPSHLQVVLRGMDSVVNGERGTARRVRLPEPSVAMAGKTGTSQVRRITRQERAAGLPRPEDVEWRYRDHALFVCYAPVDRPRFAVCVIVEHGGGGSAVAAPIAQEIMIQALRRTPQQLMLTQVADCSDALRTTR